MIGLLVFALAPEPRVDPVFAMAKRYLGSWKGTVANHAAVTYKFTLAQGGAVVIADGLIDATSEHPTPARATIGWDPVAKQVYYLDQHGADTIYFGHVTRDGDDLVFDFNALSGDTGHYRARSHLTPDSYVNSLSYEKDGKWIDMGLHVAMHRVR